MDEQRVVLNSTAKFVAVAARDNPNLGWLEFVLTDDQPNGNHQGVKREGFASLVETGLLMPLKMAKGEIKPGHNDAEPLGAIASLEEEESQVVGKAAIWKDERNGDYGMLKSMSAEGEPIGISWEIAFTESETDDDGTMWINDPTLLAATIVGVPAYGDRTPVLSVASQEGADDADPDADPDNSEPASDGEPADDGEPSDDDAGEPTDDNREGDDEEAISADELAALQVELTELREYKEKREKEDAVAALLATRLNALSESGFEYTEEEVRNKQELWLDMSDEAFEAMLEVMISLNTAATTSAGLVPDVSGGQDRSVVDIVRSGLQEMRKRE